ncbi:MAG: DNA-binding response regulator [Flavobacterium sp. BFFFF1]|uniref:LytR/AlgR family response regulator transcription factor n=1 Tax=unclassified Flavobacterium TaxID=196869 RepID=UPI000BC3E339|nr:MULTISPECIES: LytTR family DNA-binding domain-containing protein [unclassified Flavobacterium]OYU82342.1 MAG: DNA-binding response regulator [Flavobacterium sp. BFFFF1]
MIKAILIDDENHCIITLQHLLSGFKNVVVVATTQDSSQAKELIETFKPDVVFLDIEMPVLNGFDVLQQFDDLPFKVVFTTAYDQYAIKALKLNALDYLLKPIGHDDIEQVLEKYKAEQMHISKDQLNHLHQFINGKMQDTIALSTQEGLLFVKIEDIMYLEASSCYTYIVMNDKTKHLASKTMANFEEVLQDNSLFFRAHKSHIINLKFIRQYLRGEGGEIIMQDGNNIALSRNKKQEFLSLFKKV